MDADRAVIRRARTSESDRDQRRGHGAAFARQHIVRAAGGAGVHGIGRDTSGLQCGAERRGKRQEPGPAADQANIDRAGKGQHGRKGLKGDVLEADDGPRDHTRGVHDDGAPIRLVGDTETAAAVFLDLRLRAGGLAGEVDRNGLYSAGFGARSYSGTWPTPGTESSRRRSRYTSIGKAT